MIVIVLSHPRSVENEVTSVCEMFESGLDIFHLRKKAYSKKKIEEFLSQVPEKYHPQIVIHSHYSLALKYNLRGIHVNYRRKKNTLFYKLKIAYYRYKKPNLKLSASFNNLSGLNDDKRNYDYVFLSPVFDSISKSGYQSAFKHHNLEAIIPKIIHKTVALGGVEISKVEQIKKMHFAGMALSGIIWQSPEGERLKLFKEIVEKAKS